MARRLLIGLAGYPGAGKDEFASVLSKHLLGEVVLKFAHPIHDIVAALCNFYKEDLSHRNRFEDRAWKESGVLTVAGKQYTPRYLLQRIGTECMRSGFDSNIWSETMRDKIKDMTCLSDVRVITDLRFKNELEMLRQEDALIIFVDRPSSEETALTKTEFQHASESYVSTLKQEADIRLLNTGTLEEYYLAYKLLADYLNRLYVESLVCKADSSREYILDHMPTSPVYRKLFQIKG